MPLPQPVPRVTTGPSKQNPDTSFSPVRYRLEDAPPWLLQLAAADRADRSVSSSHVSSFDGIIADMLFIVVLSGGTGCKMRRPGKSCHRIIVKMKGILVKMNY